MAWWKAKSAKTPRSSEALAAPAATCWAGKCRTALPAACAAAAPNTLPDCCRSECGCSRTSCGSLLRGASPGSLGLQLCGPLSRCSRSRLRCSLSASSRRLSVSSCSSGEGRWDGIAGGAPSACAPVSAAAAGGLLVASATLPAADPAAAPVPLGSATAATGSRAAAAPCPAAADACSAASSDRSRPCQADAGTVATACCPSSRGRPTRLPSPVCCLFNMLAEVAASALPSPAGTGRFRHPALWLPSLLLVAPAAAASASDPGPRGVAPWCGKLGAQLSLWCKEDGRERVLLCGLLRKAATGRAPSAPGHPGPSSRPARGSGPGDGVAAPLA
jgi:hypothetical protein